MKIEHQQPPVRHDDAEWTPRPTLSGSEYVAREVYQEECERIWWGDWVCVGRTEEVASPGDYVVRDLAGESIFVTRNEDGELRGFYNVCSHRGTRFLDEPGGSTKKVLKCPYHAWTYDLSGRLVGTPNVKQDEHFDRARYPLHGFAVDSYAGFLFVNLAREPRPLMAALTDGAESITAFERFRMDELRVGVRIDYEVAANWKIVVENYNECLHCPVVHPELVKVVPLFRFGEVWDEETRDDGNWMVEGATSFTTSGRSELPKLPDLLPEDYSMYYGSYEFPNLMLNLHPDCAMYYIGFPKGPGHTTVVSEYLFRPETIADPDAFKPEPVVELWDLISRQDWEVCERAQTGVGSRAFTTGVFPRQDRFLYSFNEEYRHAMGRPLLG
ncbi:MAG: aromatic ring-hydroxylating dioxygenase subunit alpha [Actinobacteria bacterium]|nr:aromatic ring-hydroxylating dioxygenase subunit alpha [Actinomycetota bacterium]